MCLIYMVFWQRRSSTGQRTHAYERVLNMCCVLWGREAHAGHRLPKPLWTTGSSACCCSSGGSGGGSRASPAAAATRCCIRASSCARTARSCPRFVRRPAHPGTGGAGRPAGRLACDAPRSSAGPCTGSRAAGHHASHASARNSRQRCTRRRSNPQRCQPGWDCACRAAAAAVSADAGA